MADNIGNLNINLSAEARSFFSTMDRATKSVKDFSKVAGTALTGAIAAGFAAVSAAATKTANDFEEAMQRMAVDTGANGAALQKYADNITNALGGSANTIKDTADAIGAITNKLALSGEPLEKLGQDVATIARLTGASATELGANLGKVTNAFQLGDNNAITALDTLNQLAMSTGVNINTLSKSMAENAGQFNTLGLSFNEAASFMAVLEKNGVNAETALNGLNKATLNIINKLHIDAPSAFQAFIETIKGAKDETEALTLASDIAGVKISSTLVDAIRSGKLEFEALSASLVENSGSIKSMDEAVTTLSETYNKIINENLEDFRRLGDTIMDVTKLVTKGLIVANDVFQATVGGWALVLNGVKETWNNLRVIVDSFKIERLEKSGGSKEAIDQLSQAISNSAGQSVKQQQSLDSALDSASQKADKLFSSMNKLGSETAAVFTKTIPQASTTTTNSVAKVDQSFTALPKTINKVGEASSENARRVASAFENASEQVVENFAQMQAKLQEQFNNVKTIGERTATDIQSAFNSGIRGMIRGTQTFSDIMQNIFLTMAENIATQALSPLTSGISSALGGITGSLFGGSNFSFGNLFGGFFADGGRPPMGKVSVVGERGPELFVPDSAGTIIPNNLAGNQQSSNNSGSQPVIYYIGVEEKIRREIAAATPAIVNQSTSAVEQKVLAGGSYSKNIRG